jgi:hypothetical protein
MLVNRLAVASLILILPSCSSSSGGSAAPPAGLGYDDVAAQIGHDLCNLAAQCSPTFLAVYGTGNVDTCAALEAKTIGGGLKQPHVKITPAQMDSCRQAVTAGGCDSFFKFLQTNQLPPACVVPGDLADGTTCSYHYQCSSLDCARPTPATCGTCAPRLGAGATCASDFGCDYGLACNGGLCTKLGDRGDACNDKTPCYPWLGCVNGACGDALGEGAACKNLTSDCDLYGRGLVCVSGSCAKVSYVGVGEDCGLIGGKAAVCSNSSCQPTQLKGTCVAFADEGAACNEVDGPTCGLHGDCVAGKCVSVFEAKCE